MDSLLEIALRSRVIEKLSVALDVCLFDTQYGKDLCPDVDEGALGEEENYWDGNRRLSSIAMDDAEVRCSRFAERRAPLEDSDHLAVHCVHIFMQNLYHYATKNTDFYRQHMLSDTLLVPRLVLPYLDQCVRQARLLCHRRDRSKNSQLTNGWVDEASSSSSGREEAVAGVTDNIAEAEAALAQGIASSLRTLVIASFRAPPNKFVLGLMQRLNPTGSLLRAAPFVARHDYIFTLLCLLNVNMGALNSSALQVGNVEPAREEGEGRGVGLGIVGETPMDRSLEMVLAQGLLDDMAVVFQKMSPEAKLRVVRRVTQSGALPVSRDAPGYAAVLNLLGVFDSGTYDNDQGQALREEPTRAESKNCQDGQDWASDRKSAKTAAEARVQKLGRASASAAGDHRKREHKTGEVDQADKTSEQYPTARRNGSASLAEAKHEEATISANGREGDVKEVGSGLASLGDLPSIGKKMDPVALANLKKQRIRVDLDLPSNAMCSRLKTACQGSYPDGSRTARLSEDERDRRVGGRGQADGIPRGGGSDDEGAGGPRGSKRGRKGRAVDRGGDSGLDFVPKEFLCAINGHMMKQPARSPHGHVFELSTILLWLESRGRVCPFTGKPLSKEDLTPDEELRTRVMRWHIQKTGVNTVRGGLEGDDIYDF
ncbi:unnamed protein product [Hapterophycus canaliculatus]